MENKKNARGVFGGLFSVWLNWKVAFHNLAQSVYGSCITHRENGGKTSWDGGPLIINAIYTLYHVGIYWVYPIWKSSNRGFKQRAGPSIPRVFPPFSLWITLAKGKDCLSSTQAMRWRTNGPPNINVHVSPKLPLKQIELALVPRFF